MALDWFYSKSIDILYHKLNDYPFGYTIGLNDHYRSKRSYHRNLPLLHQLGIILCSKQAFSTNLLLTSKVH